jgi:drug/metabolite transporter (DMT)-like permease
MAMASTSAPEAADGRFRPIPSSVIIVNESTPLISQDQQLAGSQVHSESSFNLWSCLTLSSDESIRLRQLQGLVLLVISSFLFAGVSVIVKVLGNTYPSFEIVLARGCVQLPLGLLGCAIVRVNPLGKKGVRKWIFFRALASSVALSFFFYSLTQLPLIDATGKFLLDR